MLYICYASRDNHKECQDCDGKGFLTQTQTTNRIMEMILFELQALREDRNIINQYPRQVTVIKP